MSFLYRKIHRRFEMIFLIVIFIEVLVLAFVMYGIKGDLERNFKTIGEKLGGYDNRAKEFDGRFQ